MVMKLFFLKVLSNEKGVIQRSGRRKMNPSRLVKEHPAETAMPLATALAALIGNLFGLEDTDTILYLALVLSFIPAVVTWIVNLTRHEPNDSPPSTDTPAT
jgi:hypothetical protein